MLKLKGYLKTLTLSDIFSSTHLFYFFTAVSVWISPYWERLFNKYPISLFVGPLILAILLCVIGIWHYREQKNLNKEIKQKRALEDKYNSLLQLNDILFKHHINLVYNDIDQENSNLRVSLYLYDKETETFLLLSRYSKNEVYNHIHLSSQYPNQGWLHLIWNSSSGTYSFKTNVQTDKKWIKACQQENKKSCSFSGCSAKSTNCSEDSRPQFCPILSKKVLEAKSMHAKSAYGIVLKHYTEKIGILLVESMEFWDDSTLTHIKECLKKRKDSPAEILSQFGDDLLRIKSPIPDIAENMKGGNFHA